MYWIQSIYTSEFPRVGRRSGGRSCDDESVREEELCGARRLLDAHVRRQGV